MYNLMHDAQSTLSICIVTTAYPPVIDGFSTYTRDLALSLAKLGQAVTVIWADSRGNGKEGPCEFRESGIRVVRFDPAPRVIGQMLCQVTGSPHVGQSYQIYQTLRRYHRTAPFDVIEFSNWHGPAAIHSLFKIAPQILRITTTIHQAVSGSPVTRPETKAQRREHHGVKKLAALEALTVRRSDLIIAPTPGHLNAIAGNGGLGTQDAKVRIIPFGVDISDRHPRTTEATNTRPCRLLFVGRLSHRKGFDILMAALPQIIRNAKVDVVMTIIGEDVCSENGTSTWQAFSRCLDPDVRRKISYLGPVTDAEREENYQKCDLFIAPSRYESFGLMYIEAMSYGVPAIGCRAGGIPDVIDHEVTGLLVSPNDAAALAAATLQLVNDPEKRHQMGMAARASVVRKFTSEQTAQSTLEAYRTAMQSYQFFRR